jgi:hypothetical protein
MIASAWLSDQAAASAACRTQTAPVPACPEVWTVKALLLIVAIALAAVSVPAGAHHSFAIYDMSQSVEFEGVVDTVKLRNPHMALTLITTQADGSKRTINFVEGAPANMLVRMGLNPEDVAPGKRIKTIGAPRRDDSNAFFLKAIILPDGKQYSVIN